MTPALIFPLACVAINEPQALVENCTIHKMCLNSDALKADSRRVVSTNARHSPTPARQEIRNILLNTNKTIEKRHFFVILPRDFSHTV